MSIKYVCMSDLHLGEEDSLLTDIELVNNEWEVDISKVSPVMEGLLNLLEEIKKQVNGNNPINCLVLHGDVFEIALGSLKNALGIFNLFFAEFSKRGLFEKVIYIPGNHDHHFWEQTREKYYYDEFVKSGTFPDELHVQSLNQPMHCPIVDAVAAKYNIPVEVCYPLLNLEFDIDPQNPKNNRNIFIMHGHLHEKIYLLLSVVMEKLFKDHPLSDQLSVLEEENYAWIDFFWSTLGRSGQIGEKTEQIYESLSVKEKRDALIAQIAEGLAASMEFIPDIVPGEENLERRLIKKALEELVDKLYPERKETDKPITEKLEDSLKWFWNKVLPQYLGGAYISKHKDWQTSYVFGHTHKPINKYNIDSINFRSVQIFNTGGWVSEKTDKESTVHGAAITMISEKGELGHIHLYSQKEETQGAEFPRLFGDYFMKQNLSKIVNSQVAEDMVKKVRRAIAIRKVRPPQ